MNRGQIASHEGSGAEVDEKGYPRIEEYKRRVLIVEDDDRIRELLGMLMQSEGFEVVELRDGMEALRYLSACEIYGDDVVRPDLVVADIQMPEFSGLDLLMGIREHRRRPPVVMVTGIKDDEVHREARRLGAACVINKPFDIERFLRAVDEALASPPVAPVVEPDILTAYVDA